MNYIVCQSFLDRKMLKAHRDTGKIILRIRGAGGSCDSCIFHADGLFCKIVSAEGYAPQIPGAFLMITASWGAEADGVFTACQIQLWKTEK